MYGANFTREIRQAPPSRIVCLPDFGIVNRASTEILAAIALQLLDFRGIHQNWLMNLLASLFNLAGPDLLIILLIVLLLFGAKKLPELAKGMGQAVREFNSAKDDFERELHKSSSELTVKKPVEQQAHVSAAADPAKPAESPMVTPAAPQQVAATPAAPGDKTVG